MRSALCIVFLFHCHRQSFTRFIVQFCINFDLTVIMTYISSLHRFPNSYLFVLVLINAFTNNFQLTMGGILLLIQFLFSISFGTYVCAC